MCLHFYLFQYSLHLLLFLYWSFLHLCPSGLQKHKNNNVNNNMNKQDTWKLPSSPWCFPFTVCQQQTQAQLGFLPTWVTCHWNYAVRKPTLYKPHQIMLSFCLCSSVSSLIFCISLHLWDLYSALLAGCFGSTSNGPADSPKIAISSFRSSGGVRRECVTWPIHLLERNVERCWNLVVNMGAEEALIPSFSSQPLLCPCQATI